MQGTGHNNCLHQQLGVGSTKMAAAFRKLFRSSRSKDAGSGSHRGPPLGRAPPPPKGDSGGMARVAAVGASGGMKGATEGWSEALPSGHLPENVNASPPHVNSPTVTKRFFSRHSYIEGSSRVGPSEPVVDAALHSPKTPGSGRPKSISLPMGPPPPPPGTVSSSSAPATPAAGSGSGGFLKKSATSTAIMSEGTAKHMKMVRSRRLMKEYQELTKSQQGAKDPIFTVDLANDNLYEWKVKLLRLDPESELSRDMTELGVHHILLTVSFPDNFPFHPPFLRVLSPRIEKGFVMEGGAICMELLTPRGWASAYTIEAVIMQFAASLVKGQGRISRKQKPPKEFNKRSAESAFRSLVKTHDKYGWVTPPLAEG